MIQPSANGLVIPDTMRAISLRAPWDWYLLYASKDIENRGPRFPRNYRGRVLIQTSTWWDEDEILDDIEVANAMWGKKPYRAPNAPTLTLRYLQETRGFVVGSIEIVDAVESSDSPWFAGPLGLVIRNPIPFCSPVRLKGMQGLFTANVSTPDFQEQLRPAFARCA